MNTQIQFISAGAGSGKTAKLTEILHQELSEGRVQPSGVLATTFTKKAATELRERVRSHLITLGAYTLANAMGQARIGTVNSVCGSLLERFAFEAGLPTEQRVLEEIRAQQLLREAVDEVIEGPALAELLRVAHRLGLDAAGYGGGEVPWRNALRALIDQARANAIEPDVLRTFGDLNAERLLGLFPAPLEEDLDTRLRAAIESVLPNVQAAANSRGKKNTGEYLHFLESTLRDLQGDGMTWAQWNKLAGAAPEAGLKPTVQPVADAAALHSHHWRLHADLRRYLQLIFALAADALQAYDQLKLQLGAIDFTDQERKLLDILDLPLVSQTLSEELELLMVDEFQDTSPIQLALFLRLARFAKQVVWVGDVKQAIYGFRGSDSALMQAMVDALPELGGTKEVLQYSWRSRPSLVGLFNEVFREAFTHLPANEVVLTPKRDELDGTPAVEDWLLEGGNKGEQLGALASGIEHMVQSGVQIIDGESKQPRPVRLADIAVLARANDTVRDIAATLRRRRIACSTAQPGLLAQPETVLALACLRRLNDADDTLATAEIISLADCEDPEAWLADRLAWLDSGAPAALWKENGRQEGGPAHPILATIRELRGQTALLSPREAVELVLTRCGVARRVVQWQQDPEQARLRLANLDQLLELVAQYENECLAGRQAATLSGFLLWTQDLATEGLDELPQPGIDAVQVMTHHAAKGLQWPVVVLCDLASDVKDRLWDIQAESRSGFDVQQPLRDRFLRYWPWPFGAQQRAPVADSIAVSPAGQAIRAEVIGEAKRLLYVSMTRARDVLVLARPVKKPVGEWMNTVSLDSWLPAADAGALTLARGATVPFARSVLTGTTADLHAPAQAGDLAWYEQPAVLTVKLPLTVRPSAVDGVKATVAETVRIGSRIDTADVAERSDLGEAIHACIAADLAMSERPITEEEVRAILERMGVKQAVAAAALHGQVAAIRRWLLERWPDARWIVELPMGRVLANGQRVVGRTDLLLRTASGWILLDHKSTPQGSAQWGDVVQANGGQLAAYRDAIEAISGLSVEEIWLILPVAGAALRVDLAGADS